MFLHYLEKKSGFTMVEVVVATMVFTLTIAGLMAAISSLNRPAVESFEEVQATYIAKGLAEKLKQDINAELWDETNPTIYGLVQGSTYIISTVTHNNINYGGTYTVTNDPSGGGRWVNITITWN